MAQGYFVSRPQVIPCRQWLGDNFQEIRDWVVEGMPMSDNGDGSITVGGGWYPPNNLPLNGWVGQNGNIVDLSLYQQVSDQSVEYVVE
jgi:hypothetical protein